MYYFGLNALQGEVQNYKKEKLYYLIMYDH